MKLVAATLGSESWKRINIFNKPEKITFDPEMIIVSLRRLLFSRAPSFWNFSKSLHREGEVAV